VELIVLFINYRFIGWIIFSLVAAAFTAAPTIHIAALMVSAAGIGLVLGSGVLPAPAGLLDII
jgi:hypothetical protein